MKIVHRFFVFLTPIMILGLTVNHAAAGNKSAKDIPVTTTSEAALREFNEGRDAQDRASVVDANGHFRAAVEKDPSFTYAWLNLANAAFSTEEFNAAMRKAKATASHASQGEQLLVDINMTFLDNNAEKRLELAKILVHEYPESPRAWLRLSGVQTGLNHHEKARKSAKRAAELAPEFFLPYTTLGFSYLFNEPKDFAKAEKYMKKAVELEPSEDQFYVNLGDVYRAMSKLDEARAYYAKAVELDETNGLAHIKKAHINSFLGNFAEARTDYDESIKYAQQQNKANFANYKAFTYIHEGDHDGAHAAFGQILTQTDKMPIESHQKTGAKLFTLTNDATVCLHTGMYSAAEDVLAKRGQLLRHNIEQVGTEAYERAQLANIAYWDGLLAARKGDYAKAKNLAAKNAELVEADQNPRKMENYHDLMGLVNLLQKNYEEAVAHYRKANLTTMYTKYHLALAYEGAGQAKKAKELFRQVANWNFNSVGFALVREDAMKKS